MKLNTSNYHLLVNSKGPNTIKIENLCIKNFSFQWLLGINFDYKNSIYRTSVKRLQERYMNLQDLYH